MGGVLIHLRRSVGGLRYVIFHLLRNIAHFDVEIHVKKKLAEARINVVHIYAKCRQVTCHMRLWSAVFSLPFQRKIQHLQNSTEVILL
jgi:hypothetical protein